MEVRIFLLADAPTCALAGQETPDGLYNIERMMKLSITKGTQIKICGTCAAARRIKNTEFVKESDLSTRAELAEWISDSDNVMTI